MGKLSEFILLSCFVLGFPLAAAPVKESIILPVKAQLYENMTKRWQIKKSDVKSLEEDLLACLKKNKLKPERYHRQYAGFFKNGKKFAFINLLCSPGFGQYNKQELIEVFDGGDCYARAFIEMEKRTCELRINGES